MAYYRHWDGYAAAQAKMENAPVEEMLQLIDDLFGRDNLKFGDGYEQIRAEALRQLEIEWRVPDGYNPV